MRACRPAAPEQGAELIERMKGDALDVLGQRILLAEAIGADHARQGLGRHHPLLLHHQLERSVTTSASRHLISAGLGAVRVEHRSDTEALK